MSGELANSNPQWIQVLRRQSIRGKALKRSGSKRARLLLNRALARWGLVVSPPGQQV